VHRPGHRRRRRRNARPAAGAINIVRHAQRLTGVPRLHALLGGLHLGVTGSQEREFLS
jgi:hypothetical protein